MCAAWAQVCSGVRAMHQVQPPLAHRDVKPHNVLVRRHTPTLPAEARHAPAATLGTGSSSSAGSAAAQEAERRRRGRVGDEAEPLQGLPEQQSDSGRYHAVLMVRAGQGVLMPPTLLGPKWLALVMRVEPGGGLLP